MAFSIQHLHTLLLLPRQSIPGARWLSSARCSVRRPLCSVKCEWTRGTDQKCIPDLDISLQVLLPEFAGAPGTVVLRHTLSREAAEGRAAAKVQVRDAPPRLVSRSSLLNQTQ